MQCEEPKPLIPPSNRQVLNILQNILMLRNLIVYIFLGIKLIRYGVMKKINIGLMKKMVVGVF